MKKVMFVLAVLCFISCKKEKTSQEDDLLKEDPNQSLYGNWVGDFIVVETDTLAEETDYMYSNKINLIIKKIENNRVFGQSVVAGNARRLIGVLTFSNGNPTFTLKEPGDKKNDGRFEFTFLNDSIKGIWMVNNKQYPVWKRKYALTRKAFKYNPKVMLPEEGEYVDWFSGKTDSMHSKEPEDDGESYYGTVYRSASDVITKLNASTTLLKESDLKNLKRLELEIIRNTIFARHGYTFKKKSFRQFFDPVDWYIPVTDNMSGKLTVVEQKNISLLNRFQRYAEDNYDSFGR